MHRSRNKDFTKFLKWLWIFGIKEVLDEIDKLHHDKSVLPRVWWIGSGLAGSMPFHAAGTHTVGADLARDSTLLRCVSSYTPSIKILRRGLQRLRAASAGSGAGSGKMLLVSMPETPDANILRGVVEEADEIAKIVTTAMTAEHLCMPSVNQVLSRLGDASIIHFACHGKAADSPSESSLILCRNTRPSGEPAVLEQDHLTVGALASVHHEKARLAYLSACSTAQNKSRQLADEVIHIVSSFQAANFPSVVGCFWPANDAVSKEVAANFYDELLSDGEPKWEEGAVALALHSAVMKARDSNRKAPLNWAPYVHFGC
ncbi:CHAT domain-containing protein [Plectosphaerella cucumerina]|uniref:CHAT domain-containing protein n=1 Tax=Plectosphaerella cucumerina TaxID=40658 RepID=A0A8K0X7Y6_9PEZI|nr:CHAT domain-containing protein [Plectosphaerella cucumerina]